MKKILFILIISLAFILRYWQIVNYPAGLNADEAALGYNAYSLLLTGKDEHGHAWPVNLESFGDFKPALYAYILIPFVKLFGLTEFAVRLPSVIAGTLAVIFVWLLADELFKGVGFLSALLLAISPWHIHFSRGAWEVNLATTLMLVGMWLFVKWLKTGNILNFQFSLLNFVFAMYAYQSARVLVPLLGILLFITNLQHFKQNFKNLLLCLGLSAILLLPLVHSVFFSDAISRFSGVGLLSDIGPLNRVRELRGFHGIGLSGLMAKVLHNRPVIYSIQYFKNYFDHFDGNFLFISGDVIERNKVPETGLLYITDALFLVAGVIFLIKHQTPYSKLIWIWLLVAPVASALTFQTPHALRAQNMIVPLTIIIALGVNYCFSLVYKRRKVVCILIYVSCMVWQVSRYLHEYYAHYPKTYPSAWEYGFKQLVSYVQSNQDKYSKVYITDKYDQPYILFLFYSAYPPAKFQRHHQLSFRDKFNFSTVRQFDKYTFTSTPWEKVRDIHSTMIVAAPEDIPSAGVNVVKTINFLNSEPAFKIISN